MFYYLEGKTAIIEQNMAVIDCGGVGYAVNTTAHTLSRLKIGEKARVYTYVHVKEDAFDIFGFASMNEKHSFEMLLGVSGVGPKMALSILSSTTPEALAMAIVGEDAKALTAAPGVGKKIAERIILELRGKMESFVAGTQAAVQMSAAAAGNAQSEAVQGLMALGYTGAEAMTAIAKVDDGKAKTEELILRALRMLDNN